MSGISRVSSYSNYESSYGKLASGKRLQSASDGAADLTITQAQDAQVTGYDTGSANMQSGKEVLNISDSVLGSISDYLQRMKELGLQASNDATVGPEDKKAIQDEIDQLKQGITDVASNTSYNTQKLLDRSNSSFQMATDGNGNSTKVNTSDATLTTLGIKNFDVTGNFDLTTIDNALDKVNAQRSNVGAQSNALDYQISYNSYASYNTVASSSRLEDLDYPKAISEQKKQETLQLYSIYMQTNRTQQKQAQANLMFS